DLTETRAHPAPSDTSGSSFASIVSIAASTVAPGVIWIATNTGIIQVSRNHGTTWSDVTIPGIEIGRRPIVPSIEASPFDAGTAYAALDAHFRGDDAASIEPAHLFRPSDEVRVRRNVIYNTPFPREVPQAPNPPDGAIMYYSLGAKPSSEITIEVLDARGSVVRRMSSAPPRAVRETARPPMESSWLAPGRGLPANVGLNRANWDLRYDPPPAFAHSFEFNGNPGVTPMAPEGPLALPGLYTIRLTIDGKHYTQPLTVERDPRSRVSRAAVAAQHALVMRLYAGLEATWADFMPVAGLRGDVGPREALLAMNGQSPADSYAGTCSP